MNMLAWIDTNSLPKVSDILVYQHQVGGILRGHSVCIRALLAVSAKGAIISLQLKVDACRKIHTAVQPRKQPFNKDTFRNRCCERERFELLSPLRSGRKF
jgi:hypothetical protein